MRDLGSRALFAFRGQPNEAWALETTLYREALRQQAALDYLSSRESWLLYQFSRYAHQHKPDLPEKEDVLEWLALIQHYGGPTRLLDFTYSLLVAAFFAIEAADNDAAIWMVSLPRLNDSTQNRLGFHADGRIDEIRRAHNTKFQETVSSKSADAAVIHVEPDRIHERLWIQQGLFLAPVNIALPFMQNLAGTFGQDVEALNTTEISWDVFVKKTYGLDSLGVGKIILPRDMHKDVRSNLRAANINDATLFPGLEGFARSLRFHV